MSWWPPIFPHCAVPACCLGCITFSIQYYYQRCAIWSPILLGTTYWPFFSKNPNIYIAIAIGSIFNLSIGLVLLLLLLKSQILACSQCNIVTVLLLYISLLFSKRIKSMGNIRENSHFNRKSLILRLIFSVIQM